jgi:hypothetical protein
MGEFSMKSFQYDRPVSPTNSQEAKTNNNQADHEKQLPSEISKAQFAAQPDASSRLQKLLRKRPKAKKVMKYYRLDVSDLKAVRRDLKKARKRWKRIAASGRRTWVYDGLDLVIQTANRWERYGAAYFKLAAAVVGVATKPKVIATLIDCIAPPLTGMSRQRRGPESKRRNKWVRAIYVAKREGVEKRHIVRYIRKMGGFNAVLAARSN